MNFHGVVMDVADLNRSIDFYREVFGFSMLSQKEQLAAVGAPGGDRAQVIVLRALGGRVIAGAGHIGLRAFILEVESNDNLSGTASHLESRRLLVSRRDHSGWSAVVGRDPDRVAVVATWRPDGRITEDNWRALDDFLYGIGE